MNLLVILVIAFIAITFLLKNQRNLKRLFASAPKPSPAKRIETDEFSLMKPAGFSCPSPSSASKLFALELYSDRRSGLIQIVDGHQVREEFSYAWAVVSVTPGNGLELCRNAARNSSVQILEETEETTNDEQQLTIVARKQSKLFSIESTHKVVFSPQLDKTYELRVSLLSDYKSEWIEPVGTILSSFQLNT
ncbi:MAG: hypothetical protein AAF268_08380 [Cyanobacteria bacterium P01_A01_bin.3]